jgi:hypothetical protein
MKISSTLTDISPDERPGLAGWLGTLDMLFWLPDPPKIELVEQIEVGKTDPYAAWWVVGERMSKAIEREVTRNG